MKTYDMEPAGLIVSSQHEMEMVERSGGDGDWIEAQDARDLESSNRQWQARALYLYEVFGPGDHWLDDYCPDDIGNFWRQLDLYMAKYPQD